MSILHVDGEIGSASLAELIADGANRAAREPEFTERFQRAAGMGARARVSFGVAVWAAAVRGLPDARWEADALVAEMQRRTATGRGRDAAL